MPNMKVVQNIFNECLIYGTIFEDQGYYFKMDYSEVEELQEGMQAKIEWMNAAGLPLNDIYEAAGYSRVGHPLMDQPRFPASTMFLSDLDQPVDVQKSYEDYLKVQ